MTLDQESGRVRYVTERGPASSHGWALAILGAVVLLAGFVMFNDWDGPAEVVDTVPPPIGVPIPDTRGVDTSTVRTVADEGPRPRAVECNLFYLPTVGDAGFAVLSFRLRGGGLGEAATTDFGDLSVLIDYQHPAGSRAELHASVVDASDPDGIAQRSSGDFDLEKVRVGDVVLRISFARFAARSSVTGTCRTI